MKISSYIATAVAVGVCGFLPQIAHAQSYAFNNFDPGQTYSQYSGWFENTPNAGDSYQTGSAFVSAASGQISGIDAALTSYSNYGGGDNVGGNIDLLSDSSNTPGALLGSWSFGSLAQYATTSSNPTHFNASGVNLVAGDQYWLTIAPTVTPNSQWLVWNWNNEASPNGTVWQGLSGNGPGAFSAVSAPLGAFDVTVNPVPEASTTVTFVLMLVAGGFLLARKRTSSTIA